MRALLILVFCCAIPSAAFGQDTANTDRDVFAGNVRPVLIAHCYGCHSKQTAKPKANLRLDQLTADFDGAGRDTWREVLKRALAGEMPPKTQPRLSAAEKQVLRDGIGGRLKAADARRAAEGRVVLRRLNRIEYEHTVRDLLAVDVELRDLLPPDSAAGGFDNVAEAQHVSLFLMEKYLEAADKALSVAIANGPQPALIKRRYSLKETHQVKVASEKVFRKLDDDTVVNFTSSPWQSVILSPFYPPDRGRYRFRICASSIQSGGKPITYRVDAGTMGMAGSTRLVGYFDAPADKPAVVEFVESLPPRATIRILPYGLAHATTVHKIGADGYTGPGLAVHWIDVEGPLHESWPPASHRRIFGDLPQKPAPSYNFPKRVEVVSSDPEADATRILRAFARRAFRHAVTNDDIQPFVKLVRARLAEKRSFEQAVRVGLTAVMVAPDFLFLRERPGRLDDVALASRLSYFLWSTIPDEGLLALAEAKKLGTPAVLRAQVERMLNDKRAAAFTENFVGQWLNLRDGGFRHGQHLAFGANDPPPLSNLYVSMLQRLGVETDHFGSSTGTLMGLAARS